MYQRIFGKLDPFQHSGTYYIEFMGHLNQQLQPRSYFEIGTDTGQSLNAFSCDAVCVDPNFQIKMHAWQQRRRTLLFQSTSDDFFASEGLKKHFPQGVDISFLDGMHRAEYLLRDFINTERASHKRSLILIHDCLPLNTRMAERVPRQGEESEGSYRDAWTGDVWRVLFALKRKRPDLRVQYLDCPPTGLIAISKLNPESTVLETAYETVVEDMMNIELSDKQLRILWELYPIVDTKALTSTPSDYSAVFNCR
jgi:hypothetical protein